MCFQVIVLRVFKLIWISCLQVKIRMAIGTAISCLSHRMEGRDAYGSTKGTKNYVIHDRLHDISMFANLQNVASAVHPEMYGRLMQSSLARLKEAKLVPWTSLLPLVRSLFSQNSSKCNIEYN